MMIDFQFLMNYGFFVVIPIMLFFFTFLWTEN